MDNLALAVNDDLVFRFPKYEEGATKIELEAALLPELQKRLDVVYLARSSLAPTKHWTHLSGYRWIKGVR